MERRLDMKRIVTFLGLAFGIAWLIALVIYLTGGLVGSPVLVPGTPITLAVVLLAGGYMSAPALAHVLTRLITHEGWKGTYLRPRKRGWPYWAAAWFIPAVMTAVGAAVFFAVFPQYFDPSLGVLRSLLVKSGQTVSGPLWTIFAIQMVSGVLVAPLVNGLFTFGEEFGWRAYLLPKLMPLGGRKAMLLSGLIWGVWHWPAIAMGHNYGLGYPGGPWLGMLLMVWITFCLGTFLGWLTLRAGSVWPAVIGHAAVNGIAAGALAAVAGAPSPLLGPTPAGLVGSVGFGLLTLALFLRPGALETGDTERRCAAESTASE